ncbi:hypothetical protein BAUCODRAFT_21701 [Baudoinia panamericana UAMH 10762]|uniref:Protein-lysine N-methyltransferase EFM5 n=1 Tax=Baudoinia panamericana (strain UAMH 10762) TaxID=717646 RepID=M2LZD1_BAUPA|nr:uncharacterized protein BAUCODRAFT_21701 [Baudoinia panamericana UAMH 10762]EMD00028.1 hypothetical protein BAUCODRAFT_21701 [Baudoinia panamericana UAMH 10762]
MDDDDDEVPTLSSDTLATLNAFLAEKDTKTKQFEELKAKAETDFQHASGHLSMDMFSEDWQTSQFWYTDATARLLAEQLLAEADGHSCIAVVSAPSVYVALRNLLNAKDAAEKPTIKLLEYDRRFEVFGSDFVYYDFQRPLSPPPELKGKFDRIICDPPFLSEECQTKTALTVRFLASSWDGGKGGLRFMSCTGERMAELISKLYDKLGVRMTTFEPEHSKGLSNEFRCYANFECEEWHLR